MHADEQYIDGVRVVAGCVVYRVVSGKDEAKTVEVLLITSSTDRSKYVTPKGGLNVGEHLADGAMRETYVLTHPRGRSCLRCCSLCE
jgi:hypothetical protein